FRTIGMASVLVLSTAAQAETSKQAGAPVGVSRPPNTTTATAKGGNSWFPVTVHELGTFYGQGEAVGLFEFKNPHDEAIEWRSLAPSCQCASAEIRIGERI